MVSVEKERVTIKSEGNFYASLLLCPIDILDNTKGILKEKKDNSIYLTFSKDILNPNSLFYSYLAFEKSRQVFGTRNSLYESSTLTYEGDNPVKINHFNTRLLLAFLEVQLAIGFEKTPLQEHQNAIKDIIGGKPCPLRTNYYHPFIHEDDVGIHYVQDATEKEGGYYPNGWENFIKYSENSYRAAFDVSPENFGNSPQVREKTINDFIQIVSGEYKINGIINIRQIRRFSHLIYDVLYYKGSEDSKFVLNPATNEKISYIPLIDCLLDMPYKKGAIVTFQSGCDDSF